MVIKQLWHVWLEIIWGSTLVVTEAIKTSISPREVALGNH